MGRTATSGSLSPANSSMDVAASSNQENQHPANSIKPTKEKDSSGPNGIYPTKLEERKATLGRNLANSSKQDSLDKYERGVKKAMSLQIEHEKLVSKDAVLEERRTLLSRLVRRTSSMPASIHRSDEKTVVEESEEFSNAGSKSGVPEVVAQRDSITAVSSLGFQEQQEGRDTPCIVTCKKDPSVVSSLGKSKCSAKSNSEQVPSVIACEGNGDLEESLGFSLNASGFIGATDKET